VVPILLEINIGQENSKSGLATDSHELDEIMSAAPQLQNLTIRGLMTIPPFTEDPQQARPYFRQLRDFSKKITARQLATVKMEILSMGMSHDFEVAIEEGSTCVRIGAAIFGARPRP